MSTLHTGRPVTRWGIWNLSLTCDGGSKGQGVTKGTPWTKNSVIDGFCTEGVFYGSDFPYTALDYNFGTCWDSNTSQVVYTS